MICVYFRKAVKSVKFILLFTSILCICQAFAANADTSLSFADRVNAQEAIERVYYVHRSWPDYNNRVKPPFDNRVSKSDLEAKVNDYMIQSRILKQIWNTPITAELLQDEIDRMASETQKPAVLRELFQALGNDPYVIAECLARQTFVNRTLNDRYSLAVNRGEQKPFDEWLKGFEDSAGGETPVDQTIHSNFALPAVSTVSDETCTGWWTSTSTTDVPGPRGFHKAIWTGSEMIVWGGESYSTPYYCNTGGSYDPATDTWSAISTTNAPSIRSDFTVVWTGDEMIVWGGWQNDHCLDTGGRYDPSTNTWSATSTTGAPSARIFHSAVWTGEDMIVWGGDTIDQGKDNTGGRYDPWSDSWLPTSTTGAPSAREGHTAVWTGEEMIVWGGTCDSESGAYLNTGGRYNPSTDTWTSPVSTVNTPDARAFHTAIWTGTEMIIWGGYYLDPVLPSPDNFSYFNTGGRYNPSADSWTATSTTGAPEGRAMHTTVWTGTRMIIWGGEDEVLGQNSFIEKHLNTGGQYFPSDDTWISTPTDGAPDARSIQTAVWTGNEMIVWGGQDYSTLDTNYLYSGGVLHPQSGASLIAPDSTAIAHPDDDPFTFSFADGCETKWRVEVYADSSLTNLITTSKSRRRKWRSSTSWTPASRKWKKILSSGAAAGVVYWRVIGKHGGVSEARVLNVSLAVPAVPLTPMDGASIPASTPATFTWDLNHNEKVQIEFSGTSDFSSGVEVSSLIKKPGKHWIKDSSWTPGDGKWDKITALGTTIYWRIRSKDSIGRETHSEARTLNFTS